MKEKKPSSRKRVILISCVAFAVIAAGALSAFLYLNGKLDKIHYSDGSRQTSSIAAEDTLGSGDSAQASVDQAQTEIEQNLKEHSVPLAYDRDVLNVLLIGTDNRADVGGSRSDTIILISVNQKTNKIIMTSFMRDIYIRIPGHGDNRVNAAYAYGGAKLLMQTIQENFKIRIDKYVAVDFFSFMDIVDQLGGVRIPVTQAELPVLNNYIYEINRLKGLPADDGILRKPGDSLLTGKQALGYSRIRYIGNADYQRTERQRAVLTQIFVKLKGQDIFKLNGVLNSLLADVTTNLSKGEFCSLLLSFPAYSSYSLEQDRVPIDGSHTGIVVNHMDVLSIDFAKNIKELQAHIFGQ